MGSDERFKKSKHSKKKKEKKREKSRKHKKRNSSGSSSESSENEWVEKDVKSSKTGTEESTNIKPSTSLQRDEWMTVTSLFPCVTRDQLRSAKESNKKKQEEEKRKMMLDRPGQSGRELNPYWANGGTGLPPEAPSKSEEKASQDVAPSAVGNSDWYKRALRRAKEQAEEEGCPLEDIVAERWGSLAKLQSLIAEAEEQESSKRFREGRQRYDEKWLGKSDRKYDRNDKQFDGNEKRYEKDDKRLEQDGKRRDRGEKRWDQDDRRYNRDDKRYERDEKRYDRSDNNQRGNDRDRKSPPFRFRKPDSDDEPDRGERTSYRDFENVPAPNKPRFQKPGDSDTPIPNTSHRSVPSTSGNWRKKNLETKHLETKPEIKVEQRKPPRSPSSSSSKSESDSEPEPKTIQAPLLTDAQLNELAAKLVKAEILGNDSLAAELKQKLESAREARKAQPAAAAAADKASSKEDIVVLSRTDSKGFSRPLETKAAHAEPYGGRRHKQKVETHSADGQRARYFPDDDKYSLQQMFQKEKATTVEDDREMFVRLAGKDRRGEHDLDMDDIFAERARETVSDGKIETRERDRAIREHQRLNKVLDNCQWCFDNKSSLRNLIISIGSVSYVSLPPHQSLTEGHCLVAPIRHVSCATQLDEDVWEEMQNFRKALVKMFSDRGDDCVWFESAMYLHKHPHMVWHCVPVPRESGDVAPIYFKKAILECETEWSSNKKLVDLSGKDVRKAVPKGLPYFAVDFGMQSGFAHVIEDEKIFPTNFAQEIIGGMLELDHNLWRKPRRENFEVLTRKVNAFIKEWTPYDITKKGKKRKKSHKEKIRSRSPFLSSAESD